MADADTFNAAWRESAVSGSSTTAERVSALYETHRLGIYRFLMGQGVHPGAAQELTQDVFVNLFLALERGTEILAEQSWLYGVAAKLVVDYWRREGRPMWVELDSDLMLAGSLPSMEPTPEANLVRKQRSERVAKMMARLPKEQRLGIQLRMQGMRYRAIAEILGVSVSTAAEWLSIAVERLRSAANE